MLIERVSSISRPSEAGVSIPAEVHKRWGNELVFINGEGSSTDGLNSYCMKAITIRNGNVTSMHFHVNKHETLFVASGILTLLYNDGSGQSNRITVKPLQAFVIPPGFQHQLCAFDGDVLIIEASTPDKPEDSIRVSL